MFNRIKMLMNAELKIRKDLRVKKGSIYFLKHPHLKAVKIGYATDVKTRLSALNREYKFTPRVSLEDLEYFEGYGWLEDSLHQHFKDIRIPVTSWCATAISCEWYSLEGKGYCKTSKKLSKQLNKLLSNPSIQTFNKFR